MKKLIVREADLIEYAAGDLNALDSDVRGLIARERERVGSPIWKWFQDLEAKARNPFRLDWLMLAIHGEECADSSMSLEDRLVEAIRLEASQFNPHSPGIGAGSNRQLVFSAFSRAGMSVEASGPEGLAMYRSAALAVQRVLKALAEESLHSPGLKTHETLVDEAQDTTLATAHSQPNCVLNRDRRLNELDAIDPTTATVYRLCTFTGCQDVEISSMLQLSLAEVEQARMLATAAVHVDEGIDSDGG